MMWKQGAPIVSVVAAATLFFFPLNKMLMLGWVLFFAREGRRAPGFAPIMKTLYYLQPWTMSEVFVLGAIVSIVKAHAYFDVQPDPGIWAYGVLMLLITVFSGIDLRSLWDVTEDA
jgi:paraquat-inducible protein A